jgi:hypothetical protein
MPIALTAEDAKQSLTAHVAAKGEEIFAKYGPHIGWNELQLILNDRACVRYPCEIVFDEKPLNPGEFAYPVQKAEQPEDGFTMYVHPVLMTQLSKVPLAVLYELVLVNYGEFASADDAESFGSAALGLNKEEYYQTLCDLADEIGECQGC